MAGHGDHPVSQKHYDSETLTAYVLDQLSAERAEAVRAHLVVCSTCRETADEALYFSQSVSRELQHTLDRARPTENLTFDGIAREWRKPPRRVSLRYRLTHLTSGFTFIPLLLLMALAATLLAPFNNSFARRSLELTGEYGGPPALVAVAFEDGIAVVRLDGPQTGIVRHLTQIDRPTGLSIAPDGRWLAFLQRGTLHLVETRADGLHAKLELSESAAWAWSPDSSTLAYTDGRGQLIAFDLATQTHTVLAPAGERAWGQPLWSADSAQIVYASGGAAQSIWRVNPTTGYRVELAQSPSSETALLIPAAWLDDGALLLAWSPRAAPDDRAALYRIDVSMRRARVLDAIAPAQGNHLSWPVSADGRMVALRGDHLVTLNLASERGRAVPEQIRAPVAAEWAPGGAWLAAIVSGQPGGEGLVLYAPERAKLVPVHLPAGAVEKSVAWAGPEHLFVVRQPEGAAHLELWLVSITGVQQPQRLLANITLPENGPGGWHWRDAVTIRQIADSPAQP